MAFPRGLLAGALMTCALMLAVATPHARAAVRCPGAHKRLPTTQAEASAKLAQIRATLTCLVNRERTRHRRRAWREDARVADAAQMRANDLVARGYFSHHAPDGRDASTELHARGYAFSKVGENLVRGYRTPARAVRAWRMSPAHRAILLGPRFREMGIGVAFSAGASGRLLLNGVLLATRPAKR